MERIYSCSSSFVPSCSSSSKTVKYCLRISAFGSTYRALIFNNEWYVNNNFVKKDFPFPVAPVIAMWGLLVSLPLTPTLLACNKFEKTTLVLESKAFLTSPRHEAISLSTRPIGKPTSVPTFLVVNIRFSHNPRRLPYWRNDSLPLSRISVNLLL